MIHKHFQGMYGLQKSDKHQQLMMKKSLSLTLAALLASFSLSAQFKPEPDPVEEFARLCPTPPMGWNSWNYFGCDVSEELLMETADALVASGMKDAGYEYIVVDDCWQVGRDEDGNIVCDPERFPHGMKYVADYIHSLGLKFGIYSCVGRLTCGGRPGSMGHEYQDAIYYARNGVDYLKYDFCYKMEANGKTAYWLMREALKSTGRPIVFSLCEWGTTEPWLWAKGYGHLWRTTYDISNCWTSEDKGNLGVIEILDQVADLYPYAGPGHWNDPDMLEVGNGGLTHDEEISHFSLWCMMAAPLMAGNDLRNMSGTTNVILTNKEVIAVDQDTLGIQGHISVKMGDREIWVKQLSDESWAVCFFNRGDDAWEVDFSWSDIPEIRKSGKKFMARDLWLHKDVQKTDKNLKSEIPSHGVQLFKLSPLAK